MSLVTKAIGCAKKLKHRFQNEIAARTPVYLSPVRRIERVALDTRVCAMTFDDGPCRLPANPSKTGKPLTLDLLETLERFGAKGTFDVVGDTSGNYPDKPGNEGSAYWGGVAYDHYPDFEKDADGGAAHCPELIDRILSGGHEITSHTWAHVLYGPKPLVYGNRKPLSGLDAVTDDLKKLDDFMRSRFGYEIHLSRPPHYVDNTKDGFSAYDAHARMGYQYLAASFDGAGWLPLSDYEAEVAAMVTPLARALAADPDALCGQIIFQKDGYNMARRSPVADGLAQQLALLAQHGYRVVTVSELLAQCPFRDVSPESAFFRPANTLLDAGFCVCYRDNTMRPDAPLTRGELAMLGYGCQTVERRIAMVRSKLAAAKDVPCRHPYAAAIEAALQSGAMACENGRFAPDAPVTPDMLARFAQVRLGRAVTATAPLTHGTALIALAQAL